MNKRIIIIIALISIISGAIFYWYEWRPSQIIKKCSHRAEGMYGLTKSLPGLPSIPESVRQSQKEITYKDCLRENGLE